MLDYFGVPLKSYEERYDEAISRIPLYTADWTNFNPSDPGITILETLTGFETLQQNRFEEIPFAVRRNLLKMVGFTASRGKMARVLVSAKGVREKTVLLQNHRFQVGRLSFETGRQVELDDYRLIGIFGKADDEYTEFKSLLDPETKIPEAVFGTLPKAGNELYLIANRLPEPGREISFYVTLSEYFKRNPIDEKTGQSFAVMQYELFTEKGFIPLKVRDMTNAFLNSGEIRMKLPTDCAPVRFTEAPIEGFCIRLSLLSAEYDVYPKCTALDAFLFEVWQKETISECHTFQRNGEIEVVSPILAESYLDIYCKEEKGSSYRKYEYTSGGTGGRLGRYFEREDLGEDRARIRFRKDRYSYGPDKLKNCVKAVLYTEQVMRQYSLGRVLGYDDQEVELPFEHIVADSFCIIAKRRNRLGEAIYDFVRPEYRGEGALVYHLLENDGRLIIEDAGAFIGAELYLGPISLTAGSEGNIRGQNQLISKPAFPGVRFFNPSPGTGGQFREKLESVRSRFMRDMERPYAAVTAADYERLVMEMPGLCIHKARAFMDEDRNLVKIAVKPGTDDEQPKLTDAYHRIIEKRLEERRLLTTRIEILSPVYTSVDVSVTVYVKLYYENSKELIRELIAREVDYLNTDRNFADVLKFDELFHAIEMMDCVEYVYDLSIRPHGGSHAKLIDLDIHPAENCLLVPGNISVETISFER